MIKMNVGVWGGVFTLLLSGFILYQSFEFSYSSSIGPGPGFFPVWLSGTLLLLSLFYIYESVKTDNISEERLPKGALKNILFILGCLFLFLIVVPFLGFILTGTIFLFILLFREYKWYISLGISIGASIFLFWLFSNLLRVTLPVGLFGF